MLVEKDNRTENLGVLKSPYNHRKHHDAVNVSMLETGSRNRLTAGYTFAGTALRVTGDGEYME